MTRMSVAELTLKKQIERIQKDIDICAREIQAFGLQLEILHRQRGSLQDEFDRLAEARLQRKGPANAQ